MLLIVFSIISCLIVFSIFIYNSIVYRKNKVAQARSTIEVYLSQRFVLIPNLVECVKGYMKYESDIINKITELRSSYNKTKDLKSGAELSVMCNKLIVVAEKYPKLNSSEQFLNLQRNLVKTENELQAARRLYNSEVTLYNNMIQSIPYNIIAKFLGASKEELFMSDEETKKNISITFE